ncbi:MAGa4850 family ICE element protein [Mycoplasmopsis bovis]|uniref:MAGa4850 family ICE element protein n=1 Tax=Mycoplasmopsis bovis TaxID=28903 RepID=UPI003D1920A9
MQSLLLKKKEKPVVTIAFLRKYNKKKYNKLTEEALKILFKSKLIIGEKMYKELKERKIAFEFLAIIRHLGAKANYISILHLQKLGFKRSTLTETIKFLSNLGYIEHKTGAIKLTKKPWTLKNEKFMEISSKKLWIHFLLNGSAITLWNIARIIAYKKNHSKANKSLFRNVNFVEDYETMPYKLEKKSKNKRFTTIKLIKTVVKMPESEKDFDLLRIK